MNLFRSVLFWLVLAVLGALLAQVLLQDPGYVLVRYRGSDYTTTVAAGLGILLAALFVLVLAWNLLRLPFRAWKRHRERQARAKLTEGLAAYQRGDYARAEQLLKQAADNGDAEAVARAHAARAAQARGDDAAAAAHAQALGERHPAAQAVLLAQQALARGGVAGLTLDAVARELGVTKQALYHYFDSKDALLFEVVFLESAARELAWIVRDPVSPPNQR